MSLEHVPLKNNLLLSWKETCDLETALIIAKAHLRAANDSNQGIITEKIMAFDNLYNYISNFNKNQKWTKIVFPPEIEKILSEREGKR
jgi:hypothetical protein